MLCIRQAQVADLQGISSVHQASFEGFLMTLLGGRFLLEYYKLALDYHDAVAFVAEEDGNTTGFVIGFIAPDQFYSLMRGEKWRFAKAAARHLIFRPSLWHRVLGSKRRMDRMASPTKNDCNSCELASIAVIPDRAGCGIGKSLVSAFIDQARFKGASTVFLTTDARENGAVNAFYTSAGFKVERTFEAAGGRLMHKYVYEIR